MTEQETRQTAENLTDAGCSQELIERLCGLLEQNRKREALSLLADHRKSLLDRCHDEQRKIDCLDYLVFQIEQRKLP